MFETIDKMMMAGIGAMSMTRERAEKIFDEYVEKGRAASENRSGFVKEIMDNADKTRKEFEKMVGEQVEKTMTNLHLATKEDIKRLESKLDIIEKKVIAMSQREQS